MERWTKWLGWLLLVGMILNLYFIFIYAPIEKTMGAVQKIFYFHVPSAFAAFLAFFVVAVYSALFLLKRNYFYDRISYASAEIGIIFTTIVLVTGPIWAKPAWNTWWSWDPRLTTTLILWFIYVGYLVLRDFTGEDERGARFAAVFAIVGFVDVPIVYFSIRWWRTIHPEPVLMGGEDSGLHPQMLFALLFSLAVFLLFYFYLLFTRLRLEKARMEINEMKKAIALQER